MWLGMTAGLNPFSLNTRGELELKFSPVLTKNFFTQRGTFEFQFLGKTTVRYINPKRRATFGSGSVVPSRIRLTPAEGRPVELSGGVIPAPYALQVREGQVTEIEIELSPGGASRQSALK